MANNSPNTKNLIPLNKRTKKAQREIQSKGGKASAEKARERKKISEIYAEFLSSEFDIEIDDIKEKMTGEKLLGETIKRVMLKGDSASVSLMKEIREATEGSNIKITSELPQVIMQLHPDAKRDCRETDSGYDGADGQ